MFYREREKKIKRKEEEKKENGRREREKKKKERRQGGGGGGGEGGHEIKGGDLCFLERGETKERRRLPKREVRVLRENEE